MDDSNLTVDIKRILLDQRLHLWRNSLFQAKCDLAVGQACKEEGMIEAAKKDIKRAVTAVEKLTEMIEALPKQEG